MSDSPKITIVFALRNRNIERTKRCLQSLAYQTDKNFEVIVSDYGSDKHSAREAQYLISQFDFCTYLYSEARGLQWNKQRALNSGIQQARGEYTFTSDIDMIYAANFIEALADMVEPNRLIVHAPYYLPEDFDDWDNVEKHKSTLKRAPEGAVGTLGAKTQKWFDMRGADEYYTHWGLEDNDTFHRLKNLLHLDVQFVADETAMYHQWHPSSDFISSKYAPYASGLPDDVFYRKTWYFERFRNKLIRNEGEWGTLFTSTDRPILKFLDFDKNCVIEGEHTHLLNYYNRTSPYFSRAFSHQFWQLSPGDVMIVPRLHYPRKGRKVAPILQWVNKLVTRYSLEFDFSTNRAYNFLGGLISDEYGRAIKDYYLDFPTMGGCALLMRGDDFGEE